MNEEQRKEYLKTIEKNLKPNHVLLNDYDRPGTGEIIVYKNKVMIIDRVLPIYSLQAYVCVLRDYID